MLRRHFPSTLTFTIFCLYLSFQNCFATAFASDGDETRPPFKVRLVAPSRGLDKPVQDAFITTLQQQGLTVFVPENLCDPG